MRILVPDQLITVRSRFGQRTFVIGSGLISSILAAGALLLVWTVFSMGMMLWHLTGLNDQSNSLRTSELDEVGAIGLELDRLSETANSLRSQANAALDLYQAGSGSGPPADAPVSRHQLAGSGNSGDGSTEGQIQFLLAALERAIEELDQERLLHSERASDLEELEFRTKLHNERMNRLVSRLIESIALASGGLESIFRRLNLSPDSMAAEARRLYSGIGGPDLAHPEFDAPDESDRHLQSLGLDRLSEQVDLMNLYRLAYLSVPIGHPVRGANRFTSGFGYRIHPLTGRRQHHDGADFAAPTGTDVVSTGGGVVTFAGRDSGYGKAVRIRHMNGITSVYGHLSRIRVKRGQRVARGQHIGDIGSTGQSTGPHLHYEIRLGRKAVDPTTFIRANNYVY